MLSAEKGYQKAQDEIQKKTAKARAEWEERMGGPRISDKFKTPAELKGMGEVPGVGGSGGGAGGGGDAASKPPGMRFGLTSLAGLADTMQQEAGRRLAERTANATEQARDLLEKIAANAVQEAVPGFNPKDFDPQTGARLPVGSIGG
jgi:hypothetical protein